MPQLEAVLPDGRITLNLDGKSPLENVPIISLTLFGRKFGEDGPPPNQWCPRGGAEK